MVRWVGKVVSGDVGIEISIHESPLRSFQASNSSILDSGRRTYLSPRAPPLGKVGQAKPSPFQHRQRSPSHPPHPAPPASLTGGAHSSRESRHEQQYRLLVERQHQFKLAALKAKNEGAIETAKLYLRQANGLKPMIEVSGRCALAL